MVDFFSCRLGVLDSRALGAFLTPFFCYSEFLLMRVTYAWLICLGCFPRPFFRHRRFLLTRVRFARLMRLRHLLGQFFYYNIFLLMWLVFAQLICLGCLPNLFFHHSRFLLMRVEFARLKPDPRLRRLPSLFVCYSRVLIRFGFARLTCLVEIIPRRCSILFVGEWKSALP